MKQDKEGVRSGMERQGSTSEGSVGNCDAKPKIKGEGGMRKCGLIVRVSKEEGARHKEVSIAKQLNQLRALLGKKNRNDLEAWVEAGIYEIKSISGKDLRSEDFAGLLEDIKAGRINAIVCTALNRICRRQGDDPAFRDFLDFLREHKVVYEWVDDDDDTASPEWNLVMAIERALAVFEKELRCARASGRSVGEN